MMCSGKCYLFSELQKQESQEENAPIKLSQDSQISCFIVEDLVPNFRIKPSNNRGITLFAYDGFITQSFFMKIFHPPKNTAYYL